MTDSTMEFQPERSGSGPCRRFNIGDGMIATAAIAGVLAMGGDFLRTIPRQVQVWWYYLSAWFGWWSPMRLGQMSRRQLLIELTTNVLIFASNVLFAALLPATVATLAIRLRRPRPRFGVLVRQPGTSACIAAVVALIVGIDVAFVSNWVVPLNLAVVGLAVAVTGLVLAMTGLRKPERGWIDRSGRLVGVGWIVASVAAVILPRL